MSKPGDPRFNPFPGLRPFETEEEYLFFGRERQRQELVELLRKQRFIAVLGASGGGKSSLVRAGLLPALFGGVMLGAGSFWHVALLRPGGSPIRALAEALRQTELWPAAEGPSSLEIETALARSGRGLIEALRHARLPSTENLLVVVDQFEELFRFRARPSGGRAQGEAAAFVSLLLEAAQQTEQSIYVVLTMRSDYFGDCAQFDELPEAINRGEYLVPRLTRDQKKQAIEGPIRVGGSSITPRLMQRLLTDVGDDPDQLPVLQHALMRTWNEWLDDHAPGGPLDLRHYDAIGGMRGALSQHADEVFASLPDDRHRQVAERIFKALTERGPDNRGVRRPTQTAQLGTIAQAAEPEVLTVIDAFRGPGRTFLMPAGNVEIRPDTVVDLSHESLMRVWQRLAQWVEEEAQSARIYRRLADSATLWKGGRAGLYRDPDLQIALAWQQEARPNAAWARRYEEGFDEAMEFLEASRQHHDAEVEAQEAARRRELNQARALAEEQRLRAEEQIQAGRRLRRLVRGLGVLATIALAALLTALLAHRRSLEHARRADANARQAENSARQAAREASRAHQERAKAEAVGAKLREALTRTDFDTGVEHLEGGRTGKGLAFLARSLRTDPDYWPAAFRILTTLNQPSFPLEPAETLEQGTAIESFQAHPAGYLITRNQNEVQRIWHLPRRRMVAELQVKPGTSLELSARGQFAAGIMPDGAVKIVHLATGGLRTLASTNRFAQVRLAPASSRADLLAAQLEAGPVQLFDPSTGSHLTAPLGSTACQEFGFTPDGNRLWAVDEDGRLTTWTTAGERLGQPIPSAGAGGSFTMSPDSRTVATCSADRQQLRLWDLETGQPRSEVFHLEEKLNQPPAFTEDGALLLLVCHAESAPYTLYWKCLDTATGRPQSQFTEPGASHYCISRRAGWIATVLQGRSIRVQRFPGGELLADLPHPAFPILWMKPSPAGERLLIARDDHRLQLVDLLSGQDLGELRHEVDVLEAHFSPEGERLLTRTADSQWHLWDARSGRTLLKSPRSNLVLSQAVFSPDGSRILALERQGATADLSRAPAPEAVARASERTDRLRVWSAEIGPPLAKIIPLDGPVLHARFVGTRAVTLLGQSSDGTFARSVDVLTGERLLRLAQRDPIRPAFSSRSTLASSPDGTRVVACLAAALAQVWDLPSGSLVTNLALEHLPYHARFSPDGTVFFVASGESTNHTLRCWATAGVRPLGGPLRHGTNIAAAAFSWNARKLATASHDLRMRLWDVASGEPQTASVPLGGHPLVIEFSPDGRKVVCGLADTRSVVCDAESGQVLFDLPHGDWVRAAAFSKDGQKLVTAGGSGAESSLAHVWDANTGRLLMDSLPCDGQVQSAQFTSDGQLVAAGSATGTVRLWDSRTGKRLYELKHSLRVRSIEFSADDAWLLTASDDQTIGLWPLPPRLDPIPSWLAQLAESAAGQRLDEQGALETVPSAALSSLRQQAEAGLATNRGGVWLKWFLAGRTDRPLSPEGQVPWADYVQRLIQEDTLPALRQAVQLSPTNALALARLAHRTAEADELLERPWSRTPRAASPPEWYAALATECAPDWAEGWWRLADLLERSGKGQAALSAAEQAIRLDPKEPNAWATKAFALHRLGRPEHAREASRAASTLLEALPPSARTRWLLTPANLAARLNLFSEASALNLRQHGIAPRADGCSALLVDLSPYYNAALHENLVAPVELNLAGLPSGVHVLGGTAFDVRGLIRVGSTVPNGTSLPTSLAGIRIQARARELHFLHGAASGGEDPGLRLGRYRVHYENGESREIPLVNGLNLADWRSPLDSGSPAMTTAWISAAPPEDPGAPMVRLLKTIWHNPLPEALITTLDFAASPAGSPFLVAITLQPDESPRIVKQPQPQEAALGATVQLEVEAQPGGSWQYQWLCNGTNVPGATAPVLTLSNAAPHHLGSYSVRVGAAGSPITVESEPAGLCLLDGPMLHGAWRREVYLHIPGFQISDLTRSSRFPNHPDRVDLVHRAESPAANLGNYGVRLSGYITPPLTGEYVFYLSSDDQGALYLSSSSDRPEEKRLIASEPEWNHARAFASILRRPRRDNVSEAVRLEAGRRYYMEAVMKQGSLYDSLAVAWQIPGSAPPANGALPMAGAFLSCLDPRPRDEAARPPVASSP